MNMRLFAPVAALGCILAAPAYAEDFGNNSVIALTRAGVGPDVLLAKIGSLPCSYDVSTDSIVALKTAGVADAVIAAMVDRCTGAAKAQGAAAASSDPAAKRAPGLYVDQGLAPSHQLQKIRPTNASSGRMTGNGSLLFPFRAKLAIPQATAQTVAPSARPSFYFYFETDDSKVGDFGTSATAAAQSPSEFSLIRFKVKDGQREMNIGKVTMFGGRLGIDPKDAVQFSVTEINDGIFAVTPNAALLPGDYGFVLKAGSDAYRIYDFQIPAK